MSESQMATGREEVAERGPEAGPRADSEFYLPGIAEAFVSFDAVVQLLLFLLALVVFSPILAQMLPPIGGLEAIVLSVMALLFVYSTRVIRLQF